MINFLLGAFAGLVPYKILKTDHVHAYTAEPFQEFGQQYAVTHITGISYNPQHKSFLEKANGQLKHYLKIKEGDKGIMVNPHNILSSMFYYLIF